MSYTPTTWKDGDLVTSAKLNKLENGVAAAGGPSILIVNMNIETNTLDKTWQEIHDADICFISRVIGSDKMLVQIIGIANEDNTYIVQAFFNGEIEIIFIASNPNDYPVAQNTQIDNSGVEQYQMAP